MYSFKDMRDKNYIPKKHLYRRSPHITFNECEYIYFSYVRKVSVIEHICICTCN